LAHISRHELKQDQFRTTYDEFEDFVKSHYKELATVAGIVIVVAGLAVGLKQYQERREAEASEALGVGLKTFRAYVGEMPQSALMPGLQTFPTAQEKYKKAQEQFQEVITKFASTPEPKAVAVARGRRVGVEVKVGGSGVFVAGIVAVAVDGVSPASVAPVAAVGGSVGRAG